MRKNDATGATRHESGCADLAAWDRRIGDSAATDGALVAKLMTWRVDPALAGLRERRSLELLPADEREACLTLWNEVDAAPESHSDPSLETEKNRPQGPT